MDKKKFTYGELQPWHWFIPLFVIPFVFFFYILSPNSLAFTEQEFLTILEDNLEAFNDEYNTNYVYSSNFNYTGQTQWGVSWEQFLTFISDLDYFTTYSQDNGQNGSTWFQIVFFDYSNPPLDFGNSSSMYVSNSFRVLYTPYLNNLSISSNSLGDNIIYPYGPYNGLLLYNIDFLYRNTLYESNYEVQQTPTNSITLLSSSHKKFTFTDFNQCNVYITGDWDFYDDFTFMLQRYIDGEWEDFAGSLDYLKLLDYENPYYVHWVNMNYYPVGTYRYRALLNDSLDTYFYSEPFQITSSVIENEGNVTGTYDNGNIDVDVTIDTGNTVDNIKDFLGQPVTVTDEQFSDNFPTVEVDDPSEDFFSWIFDEIEDIFTSTSAETIEFSIFGTVYTFSSNDVFVPNNALKTLVGLSCDFSICFWIIKDVRKVINKIKEGNIEALADDDITANMV